MKTIRTVEWVPRSHKHLAPGQVRFIDQTQLPARLVRVKTASVEAIWHAIRTLQIRGAPAIGIAAAMGVVAAAQQSRARSAADVLLAVDRATRYLATSRPTAVNLFWALERIHRFAHAHSDAAPTRLLELLAREAVAMRDEDAVMCHHIGRYGAGLLKNGDTILTHCNAGALATSEFGTALAPVYVAQSQGKRIRVFADETRPLLQGARLTAWELTQAGVDVTLICDNTAAHVMKLGKIAAVLVGADRIAANGDTANKVGTYAVAVLAHEHGIPFYVLAPSSTFDPKTPTGEGIPIEERSGDEVRRGFGKLTAPAKVKVYSPAFDVTPARYITAIVCEKGILRPPLKASIRNMLSEADTNPGPSRERRARKKG